MGRYKITKLIDFCYGHRLLEHKGKCRHLHGHNGRLEVDLESDTLDRMGMVADFGDVNAAVKGWVDEHLDHTMLLCRRDPVIPMLTDLGERLYVMDQNPTAENIAQLVYEQANRLGMAVSEVRLWETPTSCAVYRPGAAGRGPAPESAAQRRGPFGGRPGARKGITAS
jgi:6-pyruvoyltetrahydropterin/6-carboxytetrahydropterin synthase